MYLGVLEAIKGDRLIKIFGQHQILRKGDLNFSETNQLRGKLRFLARLLLAIREKTETELSFSELLRPEYYDAFVAAVLEIRQSNKQLALTLGHYVKQICLLNISEGIKSENKAMRKGSEDFLKLYNSSWCTTVASSTARMQQKEKLNKSVKLPITADLIKITKFVQSEIEGELAKDTNYIRLQKLVLASLLLFNKRRPAEVADIKVSDYRLSFDNQEDRAEIMSSLTAEEEIMASRLATTLE